MSKRECYIVVCDRSTEDGQKMVERSFQHKAAEIRDQRWMVHAFITNEGGEVTFLATDDAQLMREKIAAVMIDAATKGIPEESTHLACYTDLDAHASIQKAFVLASLAVIDTEGNA